MFFVFFSISHYVQSLIKKGMPPGSGLSSFNENDETANLSQPELSQLTGTTSQVTNYGTLISDPFLNCSIFLKL